MPRTTLVPSPPDFHALFESAPGLQLVLAPDLTVVAVSEAYLKATMSKRDEILGRHLFDIFGDNFADPTAKGASNLRVSLNRVLQYRAPDTIAPQKYNIRRPTSYGGGYEQRHWSSVNSPVLGPNGEVTYIIHRVDDVTEFARLKQVGSEQRRITGELQTRAGDLEAELVRSEQHVQEVNTQLRTELDARQRAEKALRQSEERFRSIGETATDAVAPPHVRSRTIAIVAVSVILTAGIFTLDVLTPFGFIVWLFYLLPVLLSSRIHRQAWPFTFAGLSSVLIGVGLYLSPTDASLAFAWTDRLIGVALFWAAAVAASRDDPAPERLVFGLSHQTVANLMSVCLVAVLLESMTYRVTMASQESVRLVAHTEEVLTELSLTLSSLTNAETGQRGFLLTGQERYLEPYQQAVTKIPRHLERLKTLTQDNPLQRSRLQALDVGVEEKLTELRDSIGAFRKHGLDAARRIVESDRGRTVMDTLHRRVGEIESIERELPAQRLQQTAILFQSQILVLMLGGLAFVGLIAAAVLLLRREQIAQRRHATAIRQMLVTLDAATDGTFVFDPGTLRFSYVNEGAVQQVGYSREELLHMTPLDIKPEFDEPKFRAMIEPLVRGQQDVHTFTTIHRRKDGIDVPVEANLQCVGAGTDQARLIAVVRDITARKKGEEEIRRGGEMLELAKAANKELDAFSYSVSHDLRAPLRSIDGFSHALLEDCAGELNEQGKDYLSRIRAASQRMGQLIDDLLGLSRMTRCELQREPVDLSALAINSADDVRKIWPDRQVELVVASGLHAQGDRRLLQVVFDNLLGNAWKFTSKRERAVIEVGKMVHEGTTAYFVRDNGVGYDMIYAAKLFGAFERLHAATEYPGTGIGLATVQRIVARHGGRVWAEGRLDQGATFYFTLGGEKPGLAPMPRSSMAGA
jgi:PAS domain S-box-containing protein